MWLSSLIATVAVSRKFTMNGYERNMVRLWGEKWIFKLSTCHSQIIQDVWDYLQNDHTINDIYYCTPLNKLREALITKMVWSSKAFIFLLIMPLLTSFDVRLKTKSCADLKFCYVRPISPISLRQTLSYSQNLKDIAVPIIW